MNYDYELNSNRELIDYLIEKKVLVDGQVGGQITKSLIKAFPKEYQISLESEAVERAETLGAWHAIAQMPGYPAPGGLLYIVDAEKASAKDVIRFSTAIDQMTPAQIDQSFLAFPDTKNTSLSEVDNIFATCMMKLASDYKVRVGCRVEDYATGGEE